MQRPPTHGVRLTPARARLPTWFEFASAFLGVTAVSVLMGAVHRATGLIVQSLMTLAAVVGLVLYHRRPQLETKPLGMGLPENLAEEWAKAFSDGFALALVTVPAELFDEAQEAFLEDGLEALLAVDRRPVLQKLVSKSARHLEGGSTASQKGVCNSLASISPTGPPPATTTSKIIGVFLQHGSRPLASGSPA